MAIRTVAIGPRPGAATDWDKATFGIGIGAPQPVGPQLTALYEVRLAGTLYEIVSNSGRPGTGYVLLDILRSRDNGQSWVSILPAGNENKIILVAGPVVPRTRVTSFNPAANAVQLGDLLRIDMLAGSSEDWQDLETVVKWA